METQKKQPSLKSEGGFTIIEVMIVLAIAGLILAIVFLGVSALQRNTRDTIRKNYAGKLYSALVDFNNRNGQFVGCDPLGGVACTPQNGTNAARFITTYMPSGSDPTSGSNYTTGPVTTTGSYAQSAGGNTVFYYNSSAVDHTLIPRLGQVIIDIGHWCYRSKPDTGPPSNPIASSITSPDLELGKFVVLIGIENGQYYCLDNY